MTFTGIWRFKAIALMVSSAMLISAAGALASQLDEGIQAYNAHNYRNALSYFNQAIEANPANALPHYYKANTLIELSQTAQALVEYKEVLRLDPYSDMAAYARRAIKTTAPSTAADNITPQREAPESAPNQSYLEPPLSGLPTSTYLTTAGRLMTQGNVLANEARNNSALEQQSISSQGRMQAMQIRMQAQMQAEEMAHSTFVTSNGTVMPRYSKGQIRAFMRQEQEREQQAMEATAYDVHNQQELSQQKQNALANATEGLAKQLSEPMLPGDAKLDPQGTNLFVRNYSSPSPPTNSLQADFSNMTGSTNDRVTKATLSSITPTGLSAHAESLRPRHRLNENTSLDVHGNLLKN
jgi:tetratricopeptide (TPR) repeat protein